MYRDIVIPIHPEAVTTDWMTEALRGAGNIRSSRVTSIWGEPVDCQGLIGQVIRFHLNYDIVEENQVLSIIGKFPNPDPDMRECFQPIYQREIFFYQNLGSASGIPIPRYYLGVMDESSAANILLLEDLSLSARPGSLVCGCTLKEAEAALVRLAKFHAAWWGCNKLDQFPWLSHKRVYIENCPKEQFAIEFEELLHRIREEMPNYELSSSFLQSAGLLAKNFIRVKKQLYNAPITLIHNDYHLDNMFFRGSEADPEPVIIDWQVVGKGPGVTDLGYFIGFCLSPNQRKQVENDLLKIYYQTLCKNGVKDYDFSRFLLGYRLSAIEPLERLVQVRGLLDRSNPRSLALYESILCRIGSFIEDCRIDEFVG